MVDILLFFFMVAIHYFLIEFPLRYDSIFRVDFIKGTLIGYSAIVFLDSIICLIFECPKITMSVLTVFFLLFGVVNYFIYKYHGAPFTIGELKNFRTAMSVFKSYRFVMPMMRTIGMALLIFCATVVQMLYSYESFSRWTALYLVAVFGVIMYISFFSPKPILKKRFFAWSWSLIIAQYGYIPAFVQLTRCEMGGLVKKPSWYDREETEGFVVNYQKTDNTSNKTPDIIFVLNETFYDLAASINLKADKDALVHIRNMGGSIKGSVLTPGIGGGTNESEYECLTTNSMQLMPYIVTPFNVLNMRGANTILSYLKVIGYKTFATHPGENFSYRRNVAYPAMGFDGITFRKDYENPQYYGKRTEYITDSSMYENMIRWYEEFSKFDDPIFFYGLTFQNHGGWNVNPESETLVHVGKDFGRYTRIFNEFLSCISLSDEAFLELTEYFETVDRDVVVVMTGDHSPSFVKDKDFHNMGGKDDSTSLSSTPYIIWSNRDLKRPEKTDLISMPFLLPTAFEAAGMRMSPYFEFLSRLRREVPVLAGENDNELSESQRSLLERYYSIEYLNYTEPDVTRGFWI